MPAPARLLSFSRPCLRVLTSAVDFRPGAQFCEPIAPAIITAGLEFDSLLAPGQNFPYFLAHYSLQLVWSAGDTTFTTSPDWPLLHPPSSTLASTLVNLHSTSLVSAPTLANRTSLALPCHRALGDSTTTDPEFCPDSAIYVTTDPGFGANLASSLEISAWVTGLPPPIHYFDWCSTDNYNLLNTARPVVADNDG